MRSAAAATAISLLPLAGTAQTPAEPAPVRQLAVANKPWKGDFGRLLERRMIRVLVPYSRTLYYVDKGHERGVTADAVREFEQWINRTYKTGKRPVTVYLVPTTRDRLLQGVVDGLGDIAAGNLTVTPERQRLVDFALQTGRVVREVVVTGSKAAPIASLDGLAGLTVHVRKSSSYHESLTALNERFQREGKPPVVLQLVPDALEDEDLMEMANAGLIDVLVVDDWKARLWAQILRRIRVHDTVAVHEAGAIGWAIRKDSPELMAAFKDYHARYAQVRASWDVRLAQAMRRVRQINDPTRSADWKRFESLQALFARYGTRYGFDPLMLTAQGYQESRLDQSAKSAVGAVGVMQIMPATGSEMKVGDIMIVESNIHAGAKYMDILMRKYFPDARFNAGNRPLFAFAAYNAGPGNIARMRKEAAARGLDPDKWFNNVEVVVAEKIGAETTTYVRNIYKYYVTYKLVVEAQEEQRKARARVSGRERVADPQP